MPGAGFKCEDSWRANAVSGSEMVLRRLQGEYEKEQAGKSAVTGRVRGGRRVGWISLWMVAPQERFPLTQGYERRGPCRCVSEALQVLH